MTKFVILVYSPIHTPHPTKPNSIMVKDRYECLGPFDSVDEAQAWLHWQGSLDIQYGGSSEDVKIVPLQKPKRVITSKFKGIKNVV